MKLPLLAPERRSGVLAHLLLAALAYVPFFASRPGEISADTKQYLYLDAGRLLSRAASLWDPNVGAGTVTHQNIGYLFPLGPYYWLTQELGIPNWVAERLWLGSISFAAGAGVLFLFRTLGSVRLRGALVASIVYMLTPYQLAYTARISAILLPWAGLPWLVALTVRAVRRGGWRDPALFSLVTLIIGGTNATSLLLAGLAPALWLVVAVASRETTARRAIGVASRTGALVLATSMWWIAALVNEGRFGLNVLGYTETVRTVSEASSPIEVLRGLGNWFFYGGDALGVWITQSIDLTQRRGIILASFAIPVLALAAAAVVRWRHRVYFGVLVVVGMVVAVGAHPYGDPTPLGGIFKSFATGSAVGLALRSTPRAVPLIVLGLAGLLGAGVSALAPIRRVGIAAALVVGGLAIAAFPPVWRGDVVPARLARPEHLPAYWLDATAALDRQSSTTRVLELPGADFSSYRWGSTVDPITPGLMDRPWLGHELIPQSGSQATANLLNALDHRLQEGTFEPSSLVAVARFLRAGTVLLRSDLQYERYDTPRPRLLWAALTAPLAPGLGRANDFGRAVPNRAPDGALVDELELRTPAGARWPAPVALFAVDSTPNIVSTASPRRPVIVAGDGEGLVDAAASGMLSGHELVLYAGSLDRHPKDLQQALRAGADLVITDTNRRRAERWGTIRDTTGYTERAGERPLVADTEDHRLTVFPGAGDAARTVTEQRGALVVATGYGQRAVYTPDDRPVHAFDGDLSTAWRVAGEDDPRGQRLEITLDRRVTTDHVTLVQPLTGQNDRYLTRVRLRFDGGRPFDVALGASSRTASGQPVRFARRSFRRLTIELLETNVGVKPGYGGINGVGFAEVRIADRKVDEVVRLPVDVVRHLGNASLDHQLVVMMTRLRYEPGARFRQDEEPWLARRFELPTSGRTVALRPRTFALSGTARVSTNAPDGVIDTVLGTTAPGTDYQSSGHLAGDAGARASRAFDHDPTTKWVAAFGTQRGQFVGATLATPVTLDHVNLTVVADGRHSVPTRLRLETDGGATRDLALPAIADQAREGATTTVSVPFEPVTTQRVRLVVEAVRPERVIDYHTRRPVTLPVAIAETGLAGIPAPVTPAALPTACHPGMLTIDGRDVPLRLVGSPAAATDGRGVAVAPCDGQAVALRGGSHILRSTPGRTTGIDVDRVVLASARGGAPLATPLVGLSSGKSGGATGDRTGTQSGGGAGARMRVVTAGRTSIDVTVRGDGSPFWLVLGQSDNRGWEASAGSGASIGPRRLVDGYANGWLVDPHGRHSIAIALRWTPQRIVWFGLGFSALAAAVCLVLALRRRGTAPVAPDDAAPVLASPLSFAGPALSSRTAIAIVVGVGAFAAVTSRPAVGLVVAGATAVALRWARARVLLTAGAVAVLSLVALYVLVEQGANHFPPIYNWPSHFDRVSDLAWLAVMLLAADVMIEWARARKARVARRM